MGECKMIKQCKYCSKDFDTKGKRRLYCSDKCKGRHNHGVELSQEEILGIYTCKVCGVEFKHNRVKSICSEECLRICGIEYGRQNRSEGVVYDRTQYNKVCEECGKHFVTQAKPSRYCSLKCAAKNNPSNQRRNFKLYRGKEHLNDFEYKQWRTAVFERDDYKCKLCGSESIKGSLRAHHLEGWNVNIDLRYVVDNGITLCKHCHIEFHGQYGYGGNTRSQFIEFKGVG